MSNYQITLALTGDVMIGRTLNEVISDNGYEYPWGNMLSVIKSADLTIINLETTLTNSDKKVDKVFNFRSSPEKVKTLQAAEISAVTLANNHILDYDVEGLKETLSTLQNASIPYTGAGMDIDEASKPVTLYCKAQRIGLLGFTDNEPGWKADKIKPGIHHIDIYSKADRDYAISAIRKFRKDVETLIVSLHWGPNMRERPDKTFIAFAHDMIDAGADIIHGHSAHIFQGVEVYRKKLILYDLGDFVDDYAVDPALRNDHSFLFLVELQPEGIKRLKLIPTLISNYQVNRAGKSDSRWSLARMRMLSAEFGTEVSEEGEIEIGSEK